MYPARRPTGPRSAAIRGPHPNRNRTVEAAASAAPRVANRELSQDDSAGVMGAAARSSSFTSLGADHFHPTRRDGRRGIVTEYIRFTRCTLRAGAGGGIGTNEPCGCCGGPFVAPASLLRAGTTPRPFREAALAACSCAAGFVWDGTCEV